MHTDSLLASAVYLIVFPGFIFLTAYGLFLQWVDRKLCAVMQNRVGPPWYQPTADFIKLLAKETIIPDACDTAIFKVLPYFAIAAVISALMLIPLWKTESLFAPFQGNMVVVVYLLTIPTVTFFLAGWSSASPYSTVGSMRVLTQLFAYEVPLMLSLIGPAILAGSWNLSEISVFFAGRPALMAAQLIGFLVAILALQGKLERMPFDIPHAKNEIVGGQFTEYSGRLLAYFNLAVDMELVVGAALLSAVFLGGAWGLYGAAGLALFLAKTLAVTFLLALLKVLMARLRIEQMVNFCWKILAPMAMAQILLDIVIKSRL
ncbi:MAG: NADH dehydrogenase [Elusimicrobia bacterium GWC2_51_8]|nr:MAG: NADH dehydrogenase [Elusimicrobia bacterium GWA2_51_34]OGR64592.1 MAG: NADH dehydrogenase [Elusimicrobia bacterium GWC2_51_8]OGR84870.1 MAG: NADH dehydrogenase [Elusimicrobia bacterium GWF2_52_66]HAF94684.1 NADH-quinone oxidoreductase subunit H [Elusimicrobiota bacterium]HCE98446.1 NADH-quinone oxidoreductase subunit H [Elusimicrobiota bacterium]